MVFRWFGRTDEDRLNSVEQKLQTMLVHVREEFRLGMKALLGEVAAAEVNDELRSLDREVNGLEREVRRELLVHTSVAGSLDTPVVLTYMSVVKDIERVGDYAKNLLDLARDGANLAETDTGAEWHRLAEEIGGYIASSAAAFRDREEASARELLRSGDKMLGNFDGRVSALLRGETTGGQTVASALAYRYLKRVVAHMMNLLSAVVMPLDRLDYFDEKLSDRAQ